MTQEQQRIGRFGFAVGYAAIGGMFFVTFQWISPGLIRGLVGLTLIMCAALLGIWRCNDLGKTPFSTFWRDQIPIFGPLIGLAELLFKPGVHGKHEQRPVLHE